MENLIKKYNDIFGKNPKIMGLFWNNPERLKENIEKQKPYEIFLIDNHWILSGTLPTNKDGGTFLIIIDARNSKVIKITHGK